MSSETNRCTPDSLRQKILHGSVWLFALRIVSRGLGFLRILILARLLSPEDFGLMGIAMLAMALLETFSQTGFQAALIQKKENVESYLNTAWTVCAIRGVILFLVLLFFAPYIASFFNSPDAVFVIRVIAASAFVTGFKNIGIIYFQKELEFKKQFIFELSSVIADFAVAVILAVYIRNVWALVFGGITANIVKFLLSYALHSFRPCLEIHRRELKELFHFGKWVLYSNILIFLITQGDDILLGKMLGIRSLGLYQMAYLISNMPATEITHLISQITFPAYSKLQNNPQAIKKVYFNVLRSTVSLTFPLAGLIIIMAPSFVRIFFGYEWIHMVPAIQILTLFGVTRSVGATMGPILLGIGKPNIQARLSGIQFVIMAILIGPLTSYYHIAGCSLAVVIPNVFALLLIISEVKKLFGFSYYYFFENLMPPFMASFLMIFALLSMEYLLAYDMNVLSFSIQIVFGLFVYIGFLYLLDLPKGYMSETLQEIIRTIYGKQ